MLSFHFCCRCKTPFKLLRIFLQIFSLINLISEASTNVDVFPGISMWGQYCTKIGWRWSRQVSAEGMTCLDEAQKAVSPHITSQPTSQNRYNSPSAAGNSPRLAKRISQQTTNRRWRLLCTSRPFCHHYAWLQETIWRQSLSKLLKVLQWGKTGQWVEDSCS